jgi:hypothetical protein
MKIDYDWYLFTWEYEQIGEGRVFIREVLPFSAGQNPDEWAAMCLKHKQVKCSQLDNGRLQKCLGFTIKRMIEA